MMKDGAASLVLLINNLSFLWTSECTNIIAFEAPLMFQTIGFMVFVAKECLDMGAGDSFNLYKNWLQVQHAYIIHTCFPFII